MKSRFLTLGILLCSATASAMSLDWTGVYRFELMQLDRPSLTSPGEAKAYGLNYLRLSPKIIATDGVTIHSAFDILGSEDPAYANQQFGQLWGQSVPASAGDNSRSNTLGQTKGATDLRVSELYMHVQQEYGSLIVGRAPYEFGLGLTYNAGRGLFDHWRTNMDVVGYKFIVGNLSFMPMVGRVAVADAGQANTIQDQIFEFQYDSKDTGSMIGAVISRRQGSAAMNDTPFSAGAGDLIGGPNATRGDIYSMQTTSFILKREWERFKFRMEGTFMTGSYGIKTSDGNEVKNNSYGIAVEMDFPRPEGKWDAAVRLGVASGDDPTTKDNWEGFAFNRNYDVAMLLFNHRLGGADFLRTNVIKDTATHGLSNSLDDEAISNAAYLSPKIRYGWSERWDVVNSLTYAQLMVNPTNSLDFKKDLGLEWDIGLVYKPRENMRWETQVGMLLPGAAFKDGNVDRTNGFTYGFSTRAAITF